MTPKEKAIELIADMEARIEQNCNQSSREAHYNAAKQCAHIASNEVINGILSIIGNSSYMWTEDEKDMYTYWKNVQKEIQTL